MNDFLRTGPTTDGIFPYQTPSGYARWAADYRDPKTNKRKRRKGFRTKGAASAFKLRMERVRDGIEPAIEEDLTLAQAIERFLRNYRTRDQ